jgi:oxygen-dependent protoporphyrinogen oxidase
VSGAGASADHRPLVAVVGAGVSGLAAAWRLARSPGGPRVVVLEQAGRTGGVLLRRPVPGAPVPLVVDVGAEALLARRPEAVRLAREVGLGDALEHPATTRAAIFSRGALHPMPAGTLMGVPGDPESLRGLLTDEEVARAAAEPARDWSPLPGDVDVAGWVGGRVGAAVVDRLVEPLLGGVYAGHADRLSLRATVPALWPVAESGASVVEAVAARTGAGTAAGGPVFAGIRGGVARLAEALTVRLAEAGAQVRTGTCVQQLSPRAGGGWRLRLGPAAAPERLDVDGVVLALPAGRSARLLHGVVPDGAAALGEVRTASMALATVVLPGDALDGLGDGEPLSGVLVPPAEGRLVKAMTFSTSKWAWVREAARGHAVVRLSVGRAGEERVLQRGDEDLLAAAVADAGELLGRPLQPLAGMVTRWGGGLPQYAVGHVDLVERVRSAVAEHAGLAVAGAAFDGLGVPACIASGEAAADRVLAGL